VSVQTKTPQVILHAREALLAWKDRMVARIPADASADEAILSGLVDSYLYLVGALAKAHVSLRRLKRWLFGPQSAVDLIRLQILAGSKKQEALAFDEVSHLIRKRNFVFLSGSTRNTYVGRAHNTRIPNVTQGWSPADRG